MASAAEPDSQLMPITIEELRNFAFFLKNNFPIAPASSEDLTKMSDSRSSEEWLTDDKPKLRAEEPPLGIACIIFVDAKGNCKGLAAKDYDFKNINVSLPNEVASAPAPDVGENKELFTILAAEDSPTKNNEDVFIEFVSKNMRDAENDLDSSLNFPSAPSEENCRPRPLPLCLKTIEVYFTPQSNLVASALEADPVEAVKLVARFGDNTNGNGQVKSLLDQLSPEVIEQLAEVMARGLMKQSQRKRQSWMEIASKLVKQLEDQLEVEEKRLKGYSPDLFPIKAPAVEALPDSSIGLAEACVRKCGDKLSCLKRCAKNAVKKYHDDEWW